MRTQIFALAVTVVMAVTMTTTIMAERKNWVLLIAGSNYYYNYRHQADVCHAYQIFHKAGIPDEQIIVMMYDDIAQNDQNPFKGNIINHIKGPNVYPGVPKDYTGKEVTAKNFLAALQGDKEAVRESLGRDGKVIDSGPEDHIFVNFADHGGPGILGIPTGDYIKARAINDALKKMHKEKRFAKLVFYIEACESGSIFKGLLPDDIDVYATTAANAQESSYACYDDDSRNTYLGDWYSVSWMEDTDKADIKKETFRQQFEKVKARVNTSHVQEFGNTSIAKNPLAAFFGPASDKAPLTFDKSEMATDKIRSRDVKMHYLKAKVARHSVGTSERKDAEQEFELYLEERRQTKMIFDNIIRMSKRIGRLRLEASDLEKRSDIQDWDCYETALDTLTETCPGLGLTNNDLALDRLFVLVNLCNRKDVSGQLIQNVVRHATRLSPLCH